MRVKSGQKNNAAVVGNLLLLKYAAYSARQRTRRLTCLESASGPSSSAAFRWHQGPGSSAVSTSAPSRTVRSAGREMTGFHCSFVTGPPQRSSLRLDPEIVRHVVSDRDTRLAEHGLAPFCAHPDGLC